MLVYVSALISYSSLKRLILSNKTVNNSDNDTVRDALAAQLEYFDHSVGQIQVQWVTLVSDDDWLQQCHNHLHDKYSLRLCKLMKVIH